MIETIEWWWLSYACSDDGFKGVVIVAAPDFLTACEISSKLGLSPGGEVSGGELREEDYKHITLEHCFKVLDKNTAVELKRVIDD